jgi:hypothetical protein
MNELELSMILSKARGLIDLERESDSLDDQRRDEVGDFVTDLDENLPC